MPLHERFEQNLERVFSALMTQGRILRAAELCEERRENVCEFLFVRREGPLSCSRLTRAFTWIDKLTSKTTVFEGGGSMPGAHRCFSPLAFLALSCGFFSSACRHPTRHRQRLRG